MLIVCSLNDFLTDSLGKSHSVDHHSPVAASATRNETGMSVEDASRAQTAAF